jgi:spore maturation protein CgeB
MKILYVALQYEYGMPHRGPNEIGERGFKQVFEKLGHSVVPFYFDSYLEKKDQLQIDLLAKANQEKPDLIYFILYTDQIAFETLDKLNGLAKTVAWFGDDPWRFDDFTSRYAPHLSCSVTTDPFAVEKYKKIGVQNVFLSQWAAIDQSDVPAFDGKYEFDVSFIGGSHSYRRWFIDFLRKAGIKVDAFGFNWPNGVVDHNRMIQIFQRSKINLNLSNSVCFDVRYLLHNIKNPIVVWRTPKTAPQIKARNFEIPYYGGFQVTDYVPALDFYLDIGKDVVCYKDVDDALVQIRHYLQNDEEREKIKVRGIQRARQEHSYFHRHKKFFEWLR